MDHLQCIHIEKDKAIALALDAAEHYQRAIDSSNDTKTFVLVFELFITTVSCRPAKTYLSMPILGIPNQV